MLKCSHMLLATLGFTVSFSLLGLEANQLNAAGMTYKKTAKANLKELLNQFQTNAGAYDPLSLRILIKKIAKNNLTFRQWSEIRRYIIFNPQVGYDLIYKWERIRPTSELKPSDKENNINDSLDRADQLMIAEKFNDAFKIQAFTGSPGQRFGSNSVEQ